MKVKTLSIGLNHTPGQSTLQWAEADALALHRFFRSGIGPKLPDLDVDILLGADATRRNIERACISAHWDRPDYFVVTFSGHAGPDGIVARDGDLHHEDLGRMIKLVGAPCTLLIADTCHAGSLARHLREGRGLAGLESSWIDALARSTPGIRAMFATSASSLSHESAELGHGFFTGSFLDAVRTMNGDIWTGDGNALISDRAAFVAAAKLTRARCPSQRPTSTGLTGDLPLALSQWLPTGTSTIVGCFAHPTSLEVRVRVCGRRFMATRLDVEVTNMMGCTILNGRQDVSVYRAQRRRLGVKRPESASHVRRRRWARLRKAIRSPAPAGG